MTLLAASSCSIQFGSALAARLFARTGPQGAAALRLIIAAAVFTAVSRPRLRSLTRRDYVAISAFGVVLAALNLCSYEAIDRIPIGPAITIECLGPLAVAIVTSPGLLDLLWAALAAAGVVLVGGDTYSNIDPVGLTFAFGAAAMWGTYLVLGARTQARMERLQGLAPSVSVAALLVAPLGIAHAGSTLLRPDVLAMGAVVAIMCSVVPYSFEMLALKHLPPGVCGLLASIEPTIAAVAGFAVLGQSLTVTQTLGIALVSAATVGVALAAQCRPNRTRRPT